MTVALAVELKAEMKQFERNMAQAANTTETRLRSIERRFAESNRKVAASSGPLAHATNGIKNLAAAAPGATSGLVALGVAGVGAAAAIAAVNAAFSRASAVAQWADDLDAMSTKVGISSEELQRFRYASAVADVNTQAADASLQGLNETLGAFKSHVGDAKVKKAFDFLKITPKDLEGVHTATDLLPILADRLSRVQDKAERVKLAQALKIEDLLPLLEMGANRIKDLGTEAERLGLVLNSGTVAALADMNEQIRVADERLKTASTVIYSNFVPGLVAMKQASADAAVAVANLIERLKSLPPDKMEQLQNFLLAIGPQVPSGIGIPGLNIPLQRATANLVGQALKPKPTPSLSAEEYLLQLALTGRLKPPGKPPLTPTAAANGGKKPGDGIFTGPDKNGFIGADNIGLLEALDSAVVDVTEAFKGLVKPIEENPQLKPGPPTDLVRVGDQLMTPDEFQQVHDGLYGAIRGGLEAGFEDGVPGVVRYLAQAAERALLDSIAEALTKSVLQAQNGGGASFLSAALSFGASLFGPSGASLSASAGSMTATNAALVAAGLAEGTDYAQGGITLVGERGPELLNIPRGSQVVPNDILRMMAGKNVSSSVRHGDTNIGVHMTVYANDADSFRRSERQITTDLRRRLGVSARRGF